MKKLLFVFVAVISLTACQLEDFAEEEQALSAPSKQPATITPTASTSLSVSNGNLYVVDSATSSLTLTGNLAGKTIYYAAVNTTNQAVSDDYVRYIAQDCSRSAVTESKKLIHEHSDDEEEFKCTHGEDFFPEFEEASSRGVVQSGSASAEKLVLKEGVTSKKIFVATGSNTYSKKSATLYAFNDSCNVWVIDDDAFIKTAAERKEIAEGYAEKFASVYTAIQGIFGKEADYVYSSIYGNLQRMEEVSDTGSKVNIVIYDLYGDSRSGDTIGFFSSMDYYKNGLAFSNVTVNRSNEGKYFYIDSYYAVRMFDYTVSTLAHEFQHMINFSVKAMNGKASDSNFNEMLSMLCEDLMQEKLDIDDGYSPKNRLKKFLSRYYEAGIREYNGTLQSYANAYAFGAWLIRKFGGATLVKEMMTNGKANNDCITSAVNAVNGTSYTFNELLQDFVKDCFDKTYYNPVIFENDVVTDMAPSYGIFLKSYGTIENPTESLTLNFVSDSGKTNSGLFIYVYIK